MFFPLTRRGPSGRKAAIGKGNRTNLHFSFTSTTGHRTEAVQTHEVSQSPYRDFHLALIEDADRLGNNASWRSTTFTSVQRKYSAIVTVSSLLGEDMSRCLIKIPGALGGDTCGGFISVVVKGL